MQTRLALWIVSGMVALGALFAATAPDAQACPCCGPCSKYDQRMQAPEELPLADTYVRAQPAPLGRARGARLMRLLTGATWRPQAGAPVGSANLQLVDPRAVASTLGVPVGTRTVLVRNVIRRDRRALIAVGGVLYRIAPCRDGRRMSTCLVRTDLAPTPDDLVPGGFASPPPPPPPRGLAEPEPGGE
jgi:hypothetical protein